MKEVAKNKEVEEFFRRLQSTNSNPKTELQYQSNCESQKQVKGVQNYP